MTIFFVSSCHVETCVLLVRESICDDDMVSIKVNMEGIKERKNYNIGSGDGKVPNCPSEREEAIMDAFRHFNLI